MLKCKESGGEVLGGGLRGLPDVGEGVFEPVHGVGADAGEDVPEAREGGTRRFGQLGLDTVSQFGVMNVGERDAAFLQEAVKGFWWTQL